MIVHEVEDESRSSDSDFDDRGALPRPSRSRRALPQSGPSNSRNRSGSNIVRPMSDWNNVSADVVPTPTTSLDFPFLHNRRLGPGVQADLSNDSSPLDCFRALFDDEVCDLLMNSINEFAAYTVSKNTSLLQHSRLGKWVDIDRSELFKFLSVLTTMGVDHRASIEDYHSQHMALYTPYYTQMFSLKRFQILYSTMLHVGEVDAQGKAKIEPFVDLMVGKFNKAFTPFQNIAIDEMVIGWKGRWKYTQYNASKPSKYHIKSFGMTDSATGYVLNLLTYYGTETSYDPEADQDSGQAVKVFDTLLNVIHGKGYHIFADRYYTTRRLIDHLAQRELHYTGTVQSNRVGFPPEVKTLRIGHMETRHWLTEPSTIMCVAWKDKKAKKPLLKPPLSLYQKKGKLSPQLLIATIKIWEGVIWRTRWWNIMVTKIEKV